MFDNLKDDFLNGLKRGAASGVLSGLSALKGRSLSIPFIASAAAHDALNTGLWSLPFSTVNSLFLSKNRNQEDFNNNGYFTEDMRYRSPLLDRLSTGTVKPTPHLEKDQRKQPLQGVVAALPDGIMRDIISNLSERIDPNTGYFKWTGNMTPEEDKNAPVIHRAMTRLGASVLNSIPFAFNLALGKKEQEMTQRHQNEMKKIKSGRMDFVYGDQGALNNDRFSNIDADHSKRSDIRLLYNAQRMKQIGKTAEQIKHATGWFYDDADRRWKKWAPDGKLKDNYQALLPHASSRLETTLDAIYDAPALYKTYPELKNQKIIADEKEFANVPRNVRALYSPKKDTIYLRPSNILNPLDQINVLSDVIHEIQHKIQHFEGFSVGTAQSILNRAQNRERDFYEKRIKPLVETYGKVTQLPDHYLDDIWAAHDDKAHAIAELRKLAVNEYQQPGNDPLYSVKKKAWENALNNATNRLEGGLFILPPVLRKKLTGLFNAAIEDSVVSKYSESGVYQLMNNEAEARNASKIGILSQILHANGSLKKNKTMPWFSNYDIPREFAIANPARPQIIIPKPKRLWKKKNDAN